MAVDCAESVLIDIYFFESGGSVEVTSILWDRVRCQVGLFRYLLDKIDGSVFPPLFIIIIVEL
jgi:hypothetical protein